MAILTSVRDYCTLLAKSRLLPAEDIESAYRQWKVEGPRQDDQVDAFCKHLVTKCGLTEWQAAMLRRGHADGFFISKYKILDRIGKGQMGGVYKAVHGSGQEVALKILPASRARDQHMLGRFQREARLLPQLDHPNVVRAYQVGESGGINFIAMEFLDGETLDEVLTRRKRLPWTEAVRLIHQTLCGLQHLCERRMIHRDVKPANLMLVPGPGKSEPTWNCTIKILDIGLGRELFADDVPEAQIETQLTVEGSVLGTPDYLAPEQAKDARSADIRADIYSVGCVLFYCLAGRPVFPDTNIMSQMLKHATERPPLLTSVAPDVPPGLQSVLDAMLAKFPDDRYATPAAAATALAPFLSDGASPTAATMTPAYRQWLETEPQIELPPIPAATPASSGPAKPASPVKPGTAQAPALLTMPPLGKDGARVITKPQSPPPPAAPPAPRPAQPPTVRPPAPPRPVQTEEVDVELVTDLVPQNPQPMPLPMPLPEPERPLMEFDRRDWIMLASGAATVLAAVGIGFGLARLVRKKPEEGPAEE